MVTVFLVDHADVGYVLGTFSSFATGRRSSRLSRCCVAAVVTLHCQRGFAGLYGPRGSQDGVNHLQLAFETGVPMMIPASAELLRFHCSTPVLVILTGEIIERPRRRNVLRGAQAARPKLH